MIKKNVGGITNSNLNGDWINDIYTPILSSFNIKNPERIKDILQKNARIVTIKTPICSKLDDVFNSCFGVRFS